MATFSMQGDVGTFVSQNPFEVRQRQYVEQGLNNVLGDFVGSEQQNNALYNKLKSSQSQGKVIGYYNPGDKERLLSQGYTQHRNSLYLVDPNGQLLRVRPSSGTTAASRATARRAAGLPRGGVEVPVGYSQSEADTAFKAGKPLTQPRVSSQQVAALQAAGEEVPGYAQSALARGDVTQEAGGIPSQGVYRDQQDNFYLNGQHIDLTQFKQLGINADFVPRGATKTLEEATGRTGAGADDSRLRNEASDLEGATGGDISAAELLDYITKQPGYMLAKRQADTLKERANNDLELQLKKLAAKEQMDEADLSARVSKAKESLYASLEARGLYSSGFRTRGEAGYSEQERIGKERLKQGLSLNQQTEEARKLASEQDIELDLAKVIVSAVDAEIKARQKTKKDEEDALNEFLKSQGYVRNPVTGELVMTSAERRAEAAAGRAETREPTETEKDQYQITQINKRLTAARGTDGFTDPTLYLQERMRSRLSASDFDRRFAYLLSPAERANVGAAKLTTEQQLDFSNL